MEVYSIPLQKRAVNLIFVHNHPSGELKPSKEDKDATNHLIQVGKFVNIPVLDHMIISDKAYYSFADSGILSKLEMSLKYVPVYMQKQKALDEQREEFTKATKIIVEKTKKEGLAEGSKSKAVEMAKVLLERGVAIDVIVEASGLSKSAVEELKGE